MPRNRRREIEMTDEELQRFLAEERIVTVATIGPKGRPHLMPLWFVVKDGLVHIWTYGASQKVKNVERLAQATLLIEAGDAYGELRGAMLECDAEVVHDREVVDDVGVALALTHGQASPSDPPDLVRAAVATRGAKRVAVRFRPTNVVTWDHRKLGTAGH